MRVGWSDHLRSSEFLPRRGLAFPTVGGAQLATTELAIDFLVVDRAGTPVRDLRANELSLRVGRETVEIRQLKFVPAASEALAQGRRPNVQLGNAEMDGVRRSFLVVVDDESLPQGSEQSTRDAIATFVQRSHASDRIGLASVPHGGPRVVLTTERRPILQALQQISGRASSRESAADAGCRTKNVLRELDRLLATLGSENAPLVVLFVSGSMYDGGGLVQAPLGTSIACDLQLTEFQRVGARAAQVRSYIYVVQPETFSAVSWTSNPRAGLEHLAGAVGGKILQLSGRDQDLLNRVSLEFSGIYVASVELRSRPRAGTLQPLTVRVLRPGLDVVARPQIVIPSSDQTSR